MSSTPLPRLLDEIGLHPGPCVVLIGGGGKTTTMLRLAAEARVRGLSCIITTTTRIRRPDHIPVHVLQSPADRRAIGEALQRAGVMCVAAGEQEDKLLGLAPRDVAGLQDLADVIVVEADGSAGRPLKVHGPHEPVVPECATAVLVLAGADALGKPLTSEWVHRSEHAPHVLGAEPNSPLGAEQVARALHAAARRAGTDAPTTYVLNKSDLVSPADIHAVHDALQALAADAHFIATVYGAPVESRSAQTIA